MMGVWAWIGVVLGAWFVISVPVSLLIARSIRVRDGHFRVPSGGSRSSVRLPADQPNIPSAAPTTAAPPRDGVMSPGAVPREASARERTGLLH